MIVMNGNVQFMSRAHLRWIRQCLAPGGGGEAESLKMRCLRACFCPFFFFALSSQRSSLLFYGFSLRFVPFRGGAGAADGLGGYWINAGVEMQGGRW